MNTAPVCSVIFFFGLNCCFLSKKDCVLWSCSKSVLRTAEGHFWALSSLSEVGGIGSFGPVFFRDVSTETGKLPCFHGVIFCAPPPQELKSDHTFVGATCEIL